MSSNLIWISYSMILSIEKRIPEIELTLTSSNNNNNSNRLSTDGVSSNQKIIYLEKDSQLIISMECASYLLSTNRISDSLIFWELFFDLYFQLKSIYKNGNTE